MRDNSPTSLPLSRDALNQSTTDTLLDYEMRASDFWHGTKDHDVSQNVTALLRHLAGKGPFDILDLGCGPGRDLMAFKKHGHHPVGLDGCASFVQMAREHTGCEVLHQNFLSLDLAKERFDGIFANASIFHVPSQELARVLGELHQSLKDNGVFFSSNPRGPNIEGYNGSRYCTYMDLDRYCHYLEQAGFEKLEHYFRPAGKPRREQPWLASVWRKR